MHIIVYTSPSDKDKEASDIYPGTEINIGMNCRRKIFNFDVYIGCSQLCRQNTLPSTSDPHNNTDMQSPGGSTDNFVFKYTIWSTVCEASCHLVIWSFGHLVIWSIVHLVIWSFGHSSFGQLVIRVIQSFGHSVIQSYGHSVTIFNIATDRRTTLGSPGLLRRQISRMESSFRSSRSQQLEKNVATYRL